MDQGAAAATRITDAALDEDDEHYEDFTIATDWERFIANLENILLDWRNKPVENENIVNKWIVINERTEFAGWPFKFMYFRSQNMQPTAPGDDEASSSAKIQQSSDRTILPIYLTSSIVADTIEFPPKYTPHPIAEYYHLEEFAVLTSAAPKPIENESKLKMLLSSACIAINNTNTTFPIYVQYHHWSQNYFCGIAESCGIRTSYQMIHLRHVPDQYWYLSGLIEMFKSKLAPSLPTPIQMSAHFFYTMKTWHPHYTFETELFDVIDYLRPAMKSKGSSDAVNKLGSEQSWAVLNGFANFIPFGPLDDPFENLVFIIGWPRLSEDIVVDSADYSDLLPENAAEHYFSLNINNQIDYRLEELLQGFWNLTKERRTVEEILGKKLDSERDDGEYLSALDRIANSHLPRPAATLNRVITSVNKNVKKRLLYAPTLADLAPLSQTELSGILGYLFPDSLNNPKYPYPTAFERMPKFGKDEFKNHADILQGVKSAPVGGLVWRLSIIMSYLFALHGNVGVIANLWAELILELRFRFESSILIVGNYDSYDALVTGDVIGLHLTRYNKELPLILLIHGFKNNHTTDFSKTLVKAYLSSSYPANIISVYWKGASGSPFENPIIPEDVFYALAVENISPASKLIVVFLTFLIDIGGLTADRIHIVGFSLGAHVAGVTGHLFLQNNHAQIGRITGLDPAKPLFRFKSKDEKLDKSDAAFVDVIHTNKGMKGTEEVIGHVDFLPNRGGPTQPECANMTDFSDVFTGTCSHATSYKYFARSIKEPDIYACLCTKRDQVKTLKKVKMGDCDRDQCLEPVVFGQYCPTTLESGSPTLSTCLLNQKFQMLNCCIEKKIARETQANTRDKPEDEFLPAEAEESDDEFFDCDETLTIEDVTKVNKAVGKLKKCGRLRLLKTGEPLYEPITQDTAPLTEDVIEEQSKFLIELGPDAEGSEQRAKILSVSLTSDMQAFKAANPGAGLEDFVRWYSPRDWIESEETDNYGNPLGELSPRMKMPGNLWEEIWSSTQPVPIRRQKRLFDDTTEAEKVLQWMTSRSMKEITELLFPCILHASMLKLLDEADKLPAFYQIPVSIVQQLGQLLRTGVVPPHDDMMMSDSGVRVGSILYTFARVERDMSQIIAFNQKFPQVPLNDVLNKEVMIADPAPGPRRILQRFIKVEGGLTSELGLRINDIFRKELQIQQLVEGEFKFGSPSKRVFVLKYLPPEERRKLRKLHPDLTVPQRMSCCLKKDEFLVAGTFSGKVDLC